MSPWDECICGHAQADHHADLDEPGCAVPSCPCPWFDHGHGLPHLRAGLRMPMRRLTDTPTRPADAVRRSEDKAAA